MPLFIFVYSIFKDDNFYYGIGGNGTQWKHLTRDILVDLQKGLQLSDKKKKYRRTEIKVSKLTILFSIIFTLNIIFL